MDNETRVTTEATAELQAAAFKHNLPAQIELHEIRRIAGRTDGLACLDVSAQPALFSFHLRKGGGEWHTAMPDADRAEAARSVLDGRVCVLQSARLPFEDKTFDLVVIADLLEAFEDDVALIRECHRLLKSDGRLVVNARNAKRWSLIGAAHGLAGLSPRRLGWVRRGYSEKMLLQALRSGFDVLSLRSHRRILVECVDTCVRAALSRVGAESPDRLAAERRIYRLAAVPYRIAYQLDLLFFFTRGFAWTVAARRRPWRSRQAPVLTDGRSIPEAVLSRAKD